MYFIILYIYIFLFAIYIMKNNIRLKIRDLVRRGGSRAGNQLKIEPPQVSATSAADKVGGNIAKQNEMNQELVDMNKKLAGGAVVVPQMNQAGDSGNGSIKQQIGSALKANADGEYDTQVMDANQEKQHLNQLQEVEDVEEQEEKEKKKRKSKRKENHAENQKRRRKSKKRRR